MYPANIVPESFLWGGGSSKPTATKSYRGNKPATTVPAHQHLNTSTFQENLNRKREPAFQPRVPVALRPSLGPKTQACDSGGRAGKDDLNSWPLTQGGKAPTPGCRGAAMALIAPYSSAFQCLASTGWVMSPERGLCLVEGEFLCF